MKAGLTQSQAAAFRKRWAMANDAEIAELRATPMVRKARQLAVLMASIRVMGWDRALAREESGARRVWTRLRKVYLAQN